MKICILGLEGASSQLLFADERLANIRRLMELGTYGELQNVAPPGAVPGWVCLACSQDPGSLGVYGLRNRLEYSYSLPALAAPPGLQGSPLWDQLAAAGRKSIVFAVPPNFPPRSVAGISLGCFLTPDPAAVEFTLPASVKQEIQSLVGDYVADIRTAGLSKEALRDQIFQMSRKQWDVVRWLLREKEWDYFHFVDIGLDRLQRAFWEFFDPQHPRYRPGSPYEQVIPDYYLWLDEQIGSVLELLDEQTLLLLASTSGMQRLDGSFAINQWLMQEGLLVLNQAKDPNVTAFDQLEVNWAKTKVWSSDGPCAALYFNVSGREPQGNIPARDYESFRNQIKARVESLSDVNGQPLSAQAFKPADLYREASSVAPDLIVQLGEGRWSSASSVGHPGLVVQNLAEGCTPGGPGAFVLTAPNSPLSGIYEGAHLLDMAPTLLDLAGYEIPASMQGRSLVAGIEKKGGSAGSDNDQIIMDRLAGLGYV
ncbi:MAG TPA: alkaline phosphatase family protein [Terriglobales bacterium]|nr:alkaline phosphatase family protein [Terriglobales bacterium]